MDTSNNLAWLCITFLPSCHSHTNVNAQVKAIVNVVLQPLEFSV